MNLFWKNLFGKITPTAILEKRELELRACMQRYALIAQSAELSEYQTLYHQVNSAHFIENKKKLQNRKYRDTQEFQILKRYNKLHRSLKIKQYYEILQSAELKQFIEFEKSESYEKLGNKSEVSNSPELQGFKKFEKSAHFKLYCRFHNSDVIREYEELKIKVNAEAFKKNNEFWSNPKRWESTDDYQKETRYLELEKNPDIVFYVNEKPDRFEKLKNEQITFEDNFDWNTLNKSSWQYGFHYKNPNALVNHSFANEQQANNEAKNVEVRDGILTIHTRKEPVKARAWDETKGFIMKDFEYSSSVLNTSLDFSQREGVYKAKIRCSGTVNHAFWLGAPGKLPHINLFHFDGKKINVGNASENLIIGTKITGINPSQFYIYTLIWSKNELVWMINDVVVFRTSANVPTENMYLVFNSFIPATAKGGEGKLEVDWVKVSK